MYVKCSRGRDSLYVACRRIGCMVEIRQHNMALTLESNATITKQVEALRRRCAESARELAGAAEGLERLRGERRRLGVELAEATAAGEEAAGQLQEVGGCCGWFVEWFKLGKGKALDGLWHLQMFCLMQVPGPQSAPGPSNPIYICARARRRGSSMQRRRRRGVPSSTLRPARWPAGAARRPPLTTNWTGVFEMK